MVTVQRPPLRYHGGKWLLGPWVTSHFPKHSCYVEPFGGGASVLLQKAKVHNEIYNDLDGHVVNLFRVLRSPVLAEELRRLLALTPYASEEYDQAQAMHRGGHIPGCPVERARRTMVYSAMSYSGYTPARHLQFRRITDIKKSGSSLPARFQNLVDCLPAVTERLQRVVIENMDEIEVMNLYDSPNTLHYVDPPYMHTSRTASKGYTNELSTDQHLQLLEHLKQLQGYVVLSGYDTDLYNETLSDWQREERQECRTIGAKFGKESKKTEVLWLSPNLPRKQLTLFASRED